MAEMGWTSLPLPADRDGLGGGAVETAIVMEAMGRGLLLEPYVATIILGGGLIAACATGAQKDALLPLIGAAEPVIAFSYQARTPVSATRSEAGWVLNGSNTVVLHGNRSE